MNDQDAKTNAAQAGNLNPDLHFHFRMQALELATRLPGINTHAEVLQAAKAYCEFIKGSAK
jgi:hypothetical protein